MRFGDLAGRCVYGSTGYVASWADLQRLTRLIEFNLPVLRRFSRVVVATNFAGPHPASLVAANRDLWRSFFPDSVLLDSPENRGHSIGTADLDNLLFDHSRATGSRWLCKSANDIVLTPEVLDLALADAQFHFINAVSYDAIAQADFDLDRFRGDFFYPQDTFWVMDVTDVDHLVDRDLLDRSWRIVNRIPDYSGRIWEHIPGWSCEQLLRLAVLRNGLSRSPLLTEDQWDHILRLTVDHEITDCSMKGISVSGICHAQGLPDPTRPWAVIPGPHPTEFSEPAGNC